MGDFKYIVLERKIGKGENAIIQKIPVIFPDVLTHKLVAQYLETMFRRDEDQVRVWRHGRADAYVAKLLHGPELLRSERLC